MSLRSVVAASTAALLVLACSRQETSTNDGTWVGTITTAGNVTTVTNESGSVWGGTAPLVEEASIGVESGDEAHLLGNVTSIAAGDERIYLVDLQAVRVRVYDLNGTHELDIGSQGGGPGEFQRPVDVGYRSDGRIVVRDEVQNRVHVFAPDGDLLEDWSTEGDARRATIATDGSVFVIWEDIVPDENGEVNVRFKRYGPRGQAGDWDAFPNRPPTPMIDTSGMEPRYMMQAQSGFQAIGADWRSTAWVPFGPRVVAEVAPDGALVSGRGDAYSFEAHRDDGSVMVVEKEWDPVPVAADEADWYQSRLTALWRAATDASWVWPGPEIPAHKGAFEYIVPTVDGHFWVVRQLAGIRLNGCDPEPDDYFEYVDNPCWFEPLIADVFDEEGRFLGHVPMPVGIRYHVRPYIRGDTVIAFLEDAEGILFVKRYRLVLPGDGRTS